MAVVVEVMQVQFPDEMPENTKADGTVVVAMTGDYEAPMPFQSTVYVPVKQQPNKAAAIEAALKSVSALAQQIKFGADQAAAQHPVGG